MRALIGLTGLLMLGTSCRLPPLDPFLAAERALRRDDLLRALQAYDAVPVAHARYPDARAAAGDLELRMRRCHELILEALMLRGEWRDQEALDALRRAGDHWPSQPSLRRWIAATEQRLRLFGDRAVDVAPPASRAPAVPLFEVSPEASMSPEADLSVPLGRAVAREPVEVPVVHRVEPLMPVDAEQAGAEDSLAPSELVVGKPKQDSGAPTSSQSTDGSAARWVAAKPVEVVAQGAPAARPVASATREPAVVVPVPRAVVAPPTRLPTGEDPVALGLVAVEARLGRRQLAEAVRDLIELSRRFPVDVRVNRRLTRLLHQRALMSYGQGAVAAAVADWRRVLEIEPDNAKVRRLLARALAESHLDKKTKSN